MSTSAERLVQLQPGTSVDPNLVILIERKAPSQTRIKLADGREYLVDRTRAEVLKALAFHAEPEDPKES